MEHTFLKILLQFIMALSVGSAAYAALCMVKGDYALIKKRRNAALYAFFVYCAFILVLTITPQKQTAPDNFTLFKTIIHTFTQSRRFVRAVAYLNAALLIPLGIFLTRAFKLSFPLSALICVAVPIAIELTQLVLPFNRVFDVDDILLNSVGGIIGSAAGSIALKIRRKKIKTLG